MQGVLGVVDAQAATERPRWGDDIWLRGTPRSARSEPGGLRDSEAGTRALSPGHCGKSVWIQTEMTDSSVKKRNLEDICSHLSLRLRPRAMPG